MDAIAFQIDLKISGEYGLNKIYSGTHWAKRQQQANEIHALVVCSMKKAGIKRRDVQCPAKVHISYNSRLDIDNHGYLTKMIVDGLKGYLIADDSRKHLKSLTQDFWGGDGVLVRVEYEDA